MVKMLIAMAMCMIAVACSNSHNDNVESVDSHSVYVDVYVITKVDGTGNEWWSHGSITDMLDKVSSISGVSFTVGTITEYASDQYYVMNQKELLYNWTFRIVGRVTVVVSNPDTVDSAGRAFVNHTQSPLIIMRERFENGVSLNHAPLIFLHELGHNIGLTHESLPFNTDTYYTDDSVLSAYVTYLH